MSNHPDVMAFNQGLPVNGLDLFLQKAWDSDDCEAFCRRKILRLKHDPTANQRTVEMIYINCTRIISMQVRPRLEKILGTRWVQVSAAYPLNGPYTDLGIKYKDTGLYKRYRDLVDGSNNEPRSRRLFESDQVPTTDIVAVGNTANTAPVEAGISETDSTGSSPPDSEEIALARASFLPHGSSIMDLFSPIRSDHPSQDYSSGASIRTSRKLGPNQLDIALVAIASKDSDDDDIGPNQRVTSFAQVGFIPEQEIRGTVLAHPETDEEIKVGGVQVQVQVQPEKQHDGAQGGEARGIMDKGGLEPDSAGSSTAVRDLAVMPLSTEARTILQELIAEGIWYACILGDMASPTSSGPIHCMLVLNGWFVRMVAYTDSRVVYIEIVPGQAPLASTMVELLRWFRTGRFVHHISTKSGMEHLYNWTIDGLRAFVLTPSPLPETLPDTLPETLSEGIPFQAAKLSPNEDDYQLPAATTATGKKADSEPRNDCKVDLKRAFDPEKISKSKRRKTTKKPEPKLKRDVFETSSSSSDDGAGPRSGNPPTPRTTPTGIGREASGSRVTQTGSGGEAGGSQKTQDGPNDGATTFHQHTSPELSNSLHAIDQVIPLSTPPASPPSKLEEVGTLPFTLEDSITDAQSHREHKTILQQMELLDDLGWQVKYCPTTAFDALLSSTFTRYVPPVL